MENFIRDLVAKGLPVIDEEKTLRFRVRLDRTLDLDTAARMAAEQNGYHVSNNVNERDYPTTETEGAAEIDVDLIAFNARRITREEVIEHLASRGLRPVTATELIGLTYLPEIGDTILRAGILIRALGSIWTHPKGDWPDGDYPRGIGLGARDVPPEPFELIIGEGPVGPDIGGKDCYFAATAT